MVRATFASQKGGRGGSMNQKSYRGFAFNYHRRGGGVLFQVEQITYFNFYLRNSILSRSASSEIVILVCGDHIYFTSLFRQ